MFWSFYMNAKALIDAGICGFHAKVRAETEDGKHVNFKITSNCDKISSYGENLANVGIFNVNEETISATQSRIFLIARNSLKGACSACAVPIGIFKAMQIACGRAIPKDVEIKLSTE
jgi:hypothetical protein